jgi:hypothetical protein
MHAPTPIYYSPCLTGRTRYRMGFRKLLILQVEVRLKESLCLRDTGNFGYRWRDARISDFVPMSWDLDVPDAESAPISRAHQ